MAGKGGKIKITICGSSSFRKEKVKYKKKLESLEIKVFLDKYTIDLAAGKRSELWKRIQKDHGAVKSQYNLIEWYYNAILNSDGVLVINLDKNNIKNYIGANTFLEMGYAYALEKKIYLLNGLPQQDYIDDEIRAMQPIVINGDLGKI